MRKLMILVVLVYLAAMPAAQEMSRAGENWFSYGGDHGGTRYSSLRQITKANVSGLKEVWRFETPDGGRLQTTPLVVDGTMYVVSPRQKVIALDAATGRQKWTWDSGVATTAASRGLTWWTDGKESRLFTASGKFHLRGQSRGWHDHHELWRQGPHRSAREPARRARETTRITRPRRQ